MALCLAAICRNWLRFWLSLTSESATRQDTTSAHVERPEYERVVERVIAEIEAREVASRQARRAEEKYRSIFENAVEGIFQTTPAGCYISANPKLAQIYGYASAAELMRSLDNIERQLYVDANRRGEFQQEVEAHDTVTNFESQVYRRDGQIIWISENARAVRDEHGELLHYEGTVEDITERKRGESLRAEIDAAVAASKAKSSFLANMSHEIRTPLNGVIGMLELLASTQLDPRQQRYARIARSSAGTLLGLINDILDFSKIEAGKLELESVPFDLQQLLEDLAEMFGHRAADKGLELSCHILPGVPRQLCGDPERIRQVLINLTSNAIKFTERGEICIRAKLIPQEGKEAEVRISVRDTGIGIPTDRRIRLFAPFSQVDASTTRKYGGTGLGLAICKQLIELMHGTVGVDSEPGQGSTFWCQMPLAVVATPTPPTPDQLRGMSVLTVDDTETNLEILHDQLGSWGMQVAQARDAEGALTLMRSAVAARQPFPLVILDHQMPGMDGLDLAAVVQADPELRKSTLLMLTSVDHLLDRAQWSSAGLAGVLAKPIRQSRLYDAIVAAIQPGQAKTVPLVANAARAVSEPHSTAAANQTGPRLLVAEDNDINQLVTCEILKCAGYECDIANNGLEAIAALGRGGYALVLMDCQMPELDGFAATQRIRQLEAAGELPHAARGPIPIIALTANAIAGDRDHCLAAGMNDYATKPIDRSQLLLTIQKNLPVVAADLPAISPLPTLAICAKVSAAESEPALNLPELLSRCSGDRDFAGRVLKKFHARLPGDREKLIAALTARDGSQACQLAHGLKGAAANLAATPLRQVASEIETSVRAEQWESSCACLPRLETEIERCIRSIEALLAEEAGSSLDVRN